MDSPAEQEAMSELEVAPGAARAARRATVEDLPALHALWQKAGLPWDQLEKFVTEFQVVPGDGEGELLGAIGLQVDGEDALLHSESIRTADETEADAVRSALWTRMQIVLRNLGVMRVWTLEDAAFWKGVFGRAGRDAIQKLSATFADPTAEWLVIQLLDVDRLQRLVNEQVILRGGLAEKGDSEFQETIRKVKVFSYTLAGLVILLLMAFAGYVLMHRDVLQRALNGR